MKTKHSLLAGLAVILVAALGWILVTGDGSTGAGGPRAFDDRDLEPVSYDTDDPLGPDADPAVLDPDRTAIETLDAADDGAPDGRPQVRIEGRVVDSFGAPVAGAQVQLEFRRPGLFGPPREGRRLRQPVTTGTDGIFQFEGRGFDRMSFTLRVRHERYAPAFHDSERASAAGAVQVGDIRLSTGGRLVGLVTDRVGNGVPGATVELRPDGQHRLRWDRARGELLKPRTTDARGYYRFEHLMTGAYRAAAHAPRMQRGALRNPVSIEDGAEEQAEPIQLGPGFELAGKVYAKGGEPVGGASIQVSASEETAARNRVHEQTRSADDGSFAIDHLPGIELRVDVRAERHLTWTRVPVDPTVGHPLIVQLEGGLTVRGRVVDASTASPVERYALKVRRVADLEPSALERSWQAEIDRLRELAQRDPARRGELTARLEALSLRLRESRPDPAGTVPRAAPSRNRSGASARVPGDLGEAVDRPDGRFEVDGLDGGFYVVDVQSPDHQFVRSERLKLSRSTGDVEVVLSAERGLSVAGVVVHGPDRAPVDGARVELARPRETSDAPGPAGASPLRARFPQLFEPPAGAGPRGETVMTARTDATGRFRFANVAPGSWFVTVRHPRFTVSHSEVFELSRDLDDLRVQMRSTATLTGLVTGIPPGREGDVRVLAFAGFGRMRTERTSSDGTFRIDHLQPGDYMVRAFVGDPRSYIAQQMRVLLGDPAGGELRTDVTLRDGEQRELNLVVEVPPVGTVRGHVTINGERGAALRISLNPPRENNEPFRFRGGRFLTARTDSRGEFEIRDVPAGDYVVTAQTDGRGRQPLYGERIVVAAESELELRIPILVGGVRGTVAATDGTPAAELRGTLLLLPGVTEMPERLDRTAPDGIVHRIAVRDGTFEAERLTVGPALAVLRIPGRQRVAERIVVVEGRTSELRFEVGSRGAGAETDDRSAPGTPRLNPRRR